MMPKFTFQADYKSNFGEKESSKTVNKHQYPNAGIILTVKTLQRAPSSGLSLYAELRCKGIYSSLPS